MSESSGPDFVCIGAQKSGTTWLYDNLVGHPQVWMPPVKEIRFFNTVCPNEALLGLETVKHPRGLKKYHSILARPNKSTLKWLYIYYNGKMTTQWYYRLYHCNMSGGKLSGDITPAYTTMDERGVMYARSVLKPDCKVFSILRNPIERTWSWIKMYYRYLGENIEDTSFDKIKRDLDTPSSRLRSDYVTSVGLWKNYFGEENYQIFLYDDLKDDAEKFLNRVEGYIGIEHFAASSQLMRRSNADSAEIRMPDHIQNHLYSMFEPQVRELEAVVPGVADRWL